MGVEGCGGVVFQSSPMREACARTRKNSRIESAELLRHVGQRAFPTRVLHTLSDSCCCAIFESTAALDASAFFSFVSVLLVAL